MSQSPECLSIQVNALKNVSIACAPPSGVAVTNATTLQFGCSDTCYTKIQEVLTTKNVLNYYSVCQSSPTDIKLYDRALVDSQAQKLKDCGRALVLDYKPGSGDAASLVNNGANNGANINSYQLIRIIFALMLAFVL